MQPSNEKKPPRPPNDRDQGRNKLPDEQRTSPRSVRLNDTRWQAFKDLGGNKWLAPTIDAAIKAKRKKESPPS